MPAGRPSSYDPAFCEMLVDYFERSIEAPTRDLAPTTTSDEGFDSKGDKKSVKIEVRRICAELPTLEGFAHSISVSAKTLIKWAADFPEFEEAYARAKDIQKRLLIDRGLTRQYDPSAFQFVASNITDMKPPALLSPLLPAGSGKITVTIESTLEPVDPMRTIEGTAEEIR